MINYFNLRDQNRQTKLKSIIISIKKKKIHCPPSSQRDFTIVCTCTTCIDDEFLNFTNKFIYIIGTC